MLKNFLEPVKIVVNNKISKLTLKKESFKHPNYAAKAKEIWEMIDKDFGISTTIENVLKLKIDKFEQILVKKFPELSIKEIEKLKEKIISETNLTQTIEVSKINALKQLQDLSAKLKEENEKLKGELRKITSLLPVKGDIKSKISSESAVEDTKLNIDNETSTEKIK
jgi:hypothetical protein